MGCNYPAGIGIGKATQSFVSRNLRAQLPRVLETCLPGTAQALPGSQMPCFRRPANLRVFIRAVAYTQHSLLVFAHTLQHTREDISKSLWKMELKDEFTLLEKVFETHASAGSSTSSMKTYIRKKCASGEAR